MDLMQMSVAQFLLRALSTPNGNPMIHVQNVAPAKSSTAIGILFQTHPVGSPVAKIRSSHRLQSPNQYKSELDEHRFGRVLKLLNHALLDDPSIDRIKHHRVATGTDLPDRMCTMTK